MTSIQQPNIIALSGVEKMYRTDKLETQALTNINVSIAAGEFVSIMGPSGSGKSTLLNILGLLDVPTSGSVALHGKNVESFKDNELAQIRNQEIGFVFQSFHLVNDVRVVDNVELPLLYRKGLSGSERRRMAQEALEMVGLTARAKHFPSQLSGGQQQRVALARALVYRPRLLLMDEPLAALDKRLREDIQQEIRRIHRELGVTILYVTHDQEEALRLSDRIAVFSHGKIAQIGTGADLYERPANAFVAGFVGNSNMLQGEVVEVAEGFATVKLPDGSAVRGITPAPVIRGQKASIMIRPERLRLAGPELGAAAGYQMISGMVTDQCYLGESLQYEVEMPWKQNILARAPQTGPAGEIGLEMRLWLRDVDATVFAA